MSYPSNRIANRKVALVCARLIFQCAVGSLDAGVGIDEVMCFGVPNVSAVKPAPVNGGAIRAPHFGTIREARHVLPLPCRT